MENPMIQLRFLEGKGCSIVAKVWTPSKKIYEHPELIDLSEQVAREHMANLIANKPSLDEIINTWEFIGD